MAVQTTKIETNDIIDIINEIITKIQTGFVGMPTLFLQRHAIPYNFDLPCL